MTWSISSRRQLPFQRSTAPFCQKLEGLVRFGFMPVRRQNCVQNYDFSSCAGSMSEPAEISSLFAFNGPSDILAIPFSYSFCRSRVREFQVGRFMAIDSASTRLSISAGSR
jgi:hypothetical protein